MTWITTYGRETADQALQQLYRRIAGSSGQIDNILMAHSLRPHTLAGHMALYKNTLHHAGNRVPKWFLEALGVYVSRLNRCGYCDRHHSAGMRRLLADDVRFAALDAQLGMDAPGQPFSDAQQVALGYARQLTLRPADTHQSQVEAMRGAGFDDGRILEINQVVSYFAYANRTVLGLGVSDAGEALGLSPGDTSDPDNWSHQ